MIHFKTRNNGFSLLEVMMAMIIISFTLLPIFNLLSRIANSIETESRRLNRIIQKKVALLRVLDSSLDVKDKKNVVAIHPKSQLVGIKGLQRHEVLVSWSDVQEEREERLVSFVYVQPEEKEEKK